MSPAFTSVPSSTVTSPSRPGTLAATDTVLASIIPCNGTGSGVTAFHTPQAIKSTAAAASANPAVISNLAFCILRPFVFYFTAVRSARFNESLNSGIAPEDACSIAQDTTNL